MSKWLLSTWWREFSPGDVVEAELRDIGALVSFGMAEAVKDVEKKGVVSDESTNSDSTS